MPAPWKAAMRSAGVLSASNQGGGFPDYGVVARDPLLPVRACFDLGGSGATADAMAIWICQWVDREIRILDYIEGQGQVLAHYICALRGRGWGQALCLLPHDGVNADCIGQEYREDHRLSDAGFEVIGGGPIRGGRR